MKLQKGYLCTLLLTFSYLCLFSTKVGATEETSALDQAIHNSNIPFTVAQGEDLSNDDLTLDSPSQQSDLVPADSPSDRDNLVIGSPSENNSDFSGDIAQPPPAAAPPPTVYSLEEPSSEVVVYSLEEPEPEPQFTEPQFTTSVPSTPAPPEPTKPSAKKVELQEVTFLCGADGSTPATVAKAKDNNQVFVILWKSSAFKTAGYDDQTRCRQVSARFEEYNKGKLLTYITTGKLNGQSVICLTSKADGNCGDDSISLHQGLLFTVKPGESSEQTLETLADVLQSEGEVKQKPFEQ